MKEEKRHFRTLSDTEECEQGLSGMQNWWLDVAFVFASFLLPLHLFLLFVFCLCLGLCRVVGHGDGEEP